MNEQDKQLIEKYLRYVKKRRIIIFIIIFVITSAGIIFFNINSYNSTIVSENIIKEEITENQEIENVTSNLSNTISEKKDEENVEKQEETLTETKPVVEKPKEVVETSKPNTTTSSSKKEVEQNKTKPSNKDFLFVDGYNMDNVTQAAQDYLKSYSYGGECIPIKDNEGVYLGMRVVFY